MRVLVTGASGHVGGTIAVALAEGGHDVVGVSRHPGPVPGVYGRLDGNLADPGAAERLAGLTPPCEAVVHAAASLDKSPGASSISLVNCLGTQQVLALAERWEASLVYVSGVPVIGRPRELPVTEGHPVDPPTAYHASKLYGEHLVSLAARDGRAAASLRLTSPVGPGTPDGRIFSVFAQRAAAGEPLEVAGRGARRQDYVDVRDAAAAVAACLERGARGVFNVAGGTPVSNLDLARECVAAVGSDSPIATGAGEDPDEDVSWEVSIDRADAELGWRPRVALADSIRDYLATQPAPGSGADPPAVTS